jgi:4-amino-4-deoxy-L-arabinose transferase-like glycosyltransferase
MKSSNPCIKAVTPLAAIALVISGVIQLRAQFLTTGAICIGLAMIGFVYSIRLLERTPFSPEQLETLKRHALTAIAWVVVFDLLTLSVVYVTDTVQNVETDRMAAIAWIVSVVLSLVVIWRGVNLQQMRTSIVEAITQHRTETLILLLILGLAIILRVAGLATHPYPWSGDEASVGIEARRILSGEVTNFFDTGWSSQPNWSFIPTAITEIIFGNNIIAVRMTSALAGTLAVLFIYLTARELFNPTIALMAAAVLATLPYNVHFSRLGVNNVVDSLMSAFVFWLIAKAMNKDDIRLYYSAGIAAGLCIYTYAGTRLALILGIMTIIFLVLRQRSLLKTHWKHVGLFFSAIVVSAAPQAAYFARHRDIFFGRFGQEGILFNGWLTQQMAQTGQSALAILANQFTRTVMVFIASPAPGNFFNSPIPYLTTLESILFLLGMGFALAYMFEPKHFIALIWFWSVIFLGGVLTLNPPANTRMLMTAPAVALLIALGASKIIEYLQKFGILPKPAIVPILSIMICVISYQNAAFYMGEYRLKGYFQDANGEYAMEVGLMAKDLGSDFQIYTLGAPRVFSGFPTFDFIAPKTPRADISAETISAFTLDHNQKAAFFAIPENQQLITEISQKYPGGKQGMVYRKTKPDEILFEYYIVQP